LTVGGEDMVVGMEDEVIPERVDSGDGGEFSIWKIKAGAEGIAEGGGGGSEEVGEEVAALAKNAAQDFGDGEDELAVRDYVADGPSSPRLLV